MSGLAYQYQPKQRGRDPVTLATALVFAFLIHFIPLTYFIMPAPQPPPIETETVSVDLSDLENLAGALPSKELPAVKLPDAKTPELPPEIKPPAPALAPPPAVKPPEPPPMLPKPAKPVEAKVEPPKLAAPAPEKKSDLMPVTPMNAANIAAFDESKVTTDKAPENAHASDRNSTAADLGPKNLPRGEAYMKDGQSKIVFDREIRGEGNLPPIASDPNSGSVKVEGSPDAGKGLDTARPDRERPLAAVTPLDKPASSRPLPAPPVIPTAKKIEPPAAPELSENTAPKSKPKLAGFEAMPDGSMPLGEKVVKGPDKTATAPKQKPDAEPAPLSNVQTPDETVTSPPREKSKKDELDAFAALLDSSSKNTAGAGGTKGDKPGSNSRPGQKGHEGDGTMRPGNEESTSDVVTFNISSSAEEMAQPRFAKRLDPTAAYFKAIKRRTDAKWVAMVTARLRFRPVTGVVKIHVVIQRSGKLLEASVDSRTEGLPDEYAYMAKEAVERACDPAADPFSGELAKSDKTECYFCFFY